MTGRRGLTGTVESFAATVRNIVQLGMGGFPRLRQQPKKNPRKQLPAKLQQTRSLLTTIIGSCLKNMQVEAFRARSVRPLCSASSGFAVRFPPASCICCQRTTFSLSLSLPLSSEHRVRRRGVANEYNPPCVANA